MPQTILKLFKGVWNERIISFRAKEYLAIDLLFKLKEPEINEVLRFFWREPSPLLDWENSYSAIAREISGAKNRYEQQMKIRNATMQQLNRVETATAALELAETEETKATLESNRLIAKANFFCLRNLSQQLGDTFKDDWCVSYLEILRPLTKLLAGRSCENDKSLTVPAEEPKAHIEKIHCLDEIINGARGVLNELQQRILNGHNWTIESSNAKSFEIVLQDGCFFYYLKSLRSDYHKQLSLMLSQHSYSTKMISNARKNSNVKS